MRAHTTANPSCIEATEAQPQQSLQAHPKAVAPRTCEPPTEDCPDTWPYLERRENLDRRQRPTRWWESLLGWRQRQRGRRAGESENIYVDVYQNADLFLILSIFILNLADAYFTLDYLGRGGEEANPFANHLIASGPITFVYEKCFAVALCLIALAAHRTFRMARVGMYLLLGCYGVLTLYHMLLRIGH
jgi:hypothetical protein